MRKRIKVKEGHITRYVYIGSDTEPVKVTEKTKKTKKTQNKEEQ